MYDLRPQLQTATQSQKVRPPARTTRAFYGLIWEGYHVRINTSSDSLVYSHEKYDFYDTKEALLESIIGQSNDMLQALHERKTAYSQLMCEAHDALNALTQR
ncbi:hypothetical protein [Leclercia adecarboxylata]|uniref:hypothetical protein n=1 Tax=Leclercia adecarboxylata TaxID=83655 RepID=UPI001CC0AE03|nr:hypothetical protein [Leclercia adecarboxylata]